MNKEMKDIILVSKGTPTYIKLYMLLMNYDYYERKYIPNKLLCNVLKVKKRTIQRSLQTLKELNYIKTYTINNKRYFTIIKGQTKFNELVIDLFDYNWLEDETKNV